MHPEPEKKHWQSIRRKPSSKHFGLDRNFNLKQVIISQELRLNRVNKRSYELVWPAIYMGTTVTVTRYNTGYGWEAEKDGGRRYNQATSDPHAKNHAYGNQTRAEKIRLGERDLS
jgi:hypothetical protein